jgi:hypothetical protein
MILLNAVRIRSTSQKFLDNFIMTSMYTNNIEMTYHYGRSQKRMLTSVMKDSILVPGASLIVKQ